MAATTQTHVDTLAAQVNQDGTLSTAQKAQIQSLCYSISVVLFGSNAGSSITASSSGKNNGSV